MDQQLIQAATSHISPAPVRQESKLSGTGELEQALKFPKLKDAPVSDLQAILRRCMLLVGIRAANIPGPEETAVLLQFIYKKYEGLTVAEIQLAFEKAVAGELECEANCYENFSPEYLGRIMSAYKKWASQKWNENQMYVVKPQTTNLLTMPADWKPLYEMYYQDYIKGKFNFSVMPWEIYIAAVELGHMAPDAYEGWMKDANEQVRISLGIEIIEAVHANEKHELTEKLRKIENGEMEFKITELAKKLAVEFLYKKAKQQNRKNLFVKS